MRMVSKPNLIAALLPGLISAGVFLLIIAIGLGFPFLFLSLLPIFSAGLGKSPRLALEAAAVASGLIALLTSAIPLGIMFFVFLGLPAWLFSSLAMRALRFGEYTAWYPVGNIMAQLSLYACALICLTALYYLPEEGGISNVINQHIRASFANMPEYADMVDMLAEQWNFLLFSMLAWMWAIVLYGHAWLANRQLKQKDKAVRQTLAIHVFVMPGWVLYFLLVAALASMIGSESMQFTGKSCFITLLLPYFFLGIAVMHRTCADWPNKKFFLFFIYLMIISQVWMMAIVAAVGFVNHLMQINKRLSSGQISPK